MKSGPDSRLGVRPRRETTRGQTRLKLDTYLPYRLSVAANVVSELVARAYHARFGLSIPQWRVIAVLGEGGALTQRQICARTVMDKVTVSRAVAALARRTLIARTQDTIDGRSRRAELTLEGQSLYGDVAPIALAHEAALLGSFSEAERSLVLDLLRRLEAAAKAALEVAP